MGEHERMKVWLENGTTVYFCKIDEFETAFTEKSPKTGYQDGDAITYTIDAVIGKPLTFLYDRFGSKSYKSDTNVKDIKYDVPYSA